MLNHHQCSSSIEQLQQDKLVLSPT